MYNVIKGLYIQLLAQAYSKKTMHVSEFGLPLLARTNNGAVYQCEQYLIARSLVAWYILDMAFTMIIY